MARFVGAGAREVLRRGGRGEVLAWFPAACYVEFPQGLLVLVGPAIHPGPLYVGLDDDPPRAAVGDPAAADGGALTLGGWRIDPGERTWRGWTPPPDRMAASARIAARAAREGSGGSLLDDATREAAARLLAAADVEGAARSLVGRGPGLTPSGDDALAGVLFSVRLLRGPAAEPGLVGIAERLVSSPIARAFAVWGARGQALAPAHRLVAAAVRGDAGAARRAARVLALVGESSGADFCLGVAMALEAA